MNTSVCARVQVHVCMHAPQQPGDAYGTCIHPLTAVTLVNKADYVCFRLGYNNICYFSNYAIK